MCIRDRAYTVWNEKYKTVSISVRNYNTSAVRQLLPRIIDHGFWVGNCSDFTSYLFRDIFFISYFRGSYCTGMIP